MPAVGMATAGLYMLARDASSKKAGAGEAETDQKRLPFNAGRDASNVDAEKDWA